MPCLHSASPDHTAALAAAFAQSLRPNDCVALHGELGAGKTAFVRGLVAGLGGNPRAVSSPTFVLLNVYDLPSMRLPLYHLDAYRVLGPGDFDAIGFPELLTQGGVVVVEWPTRVEAVLPPTCAHVRLTPLSPTTRRIDIDPPARRLVP